MPLYQAFVHKRKAEEAGLDFNRVHSAHELLDHRPFYDGLFHIFPPKVEDDNELFNRVRADPDYKRIAVTGPVAIIMNHQRPND